MGYRDIKDVSEGQLAQLMRMPPHELVRVYTRQHQDAWRVARDRGYLTGSHGVEDEEVNGDFQYPYEWMRRMMAERIPDFTGDLPVWAWVKRQNERKWVTSWNVADRAIIPVMPRIIALVPRQRILLSCYDLWHAHLNNWNIALSEEEERAYDARWPSYKIPGEDPEYQEDTEVNWPLVLDLDSPRPRYVQDTHGRLSRVQACVDRIYLDEVQSVRWAD